MNALKNWIKELLLENDSLKQQVQKYKTENAKLRAMKNILENDNQHLKEKAAE
jgi:cell division protein FtsB